jgi:hypothetical protein
MTPDAAIHAVPPATPEPAPRSLPKFALLPVLAIAAAFTALLVAYANRYGWRWWGRDSRCDPGGSTRAG